jgi:hypothetical protein
MNLANVMDEIADKLMQFTGVNIFPHPVDEITPPGGVLGYPERINYYETYGNGDGDDTYEDMPLWMVTDRSDMKDARDQIAKWTDRKGNSSIITFLEKQNYMSCDDVQVAEARFDIITIAGIDYMAAMFTLNVVGEGK